MIEKMQNRLLWILWIFVTVSMMVYFYRKDQQKVS